MIIYQFIPSLQFFDATTYRKFFIFLPFRTIIPLKASMGINIVTKGGFLIFEVFWII